MESENAFAAGAVVRGKLLDEVDGAVAAAGAAD